MKRHDDLVQTRNEISKQAFAVILGQCSQSVRDKLAARPIFANVQATTDVMSLLDMIKTLLYAGATTKNQSQTSQEALENLMSFCQGPRMSNARYLEKFNKLISVMDHFGVELGVESTRVYSILANDPSVADPDAPTNDQLAQGQENLLQ